MRYSWAMDAQCAAIHSLDQPSFLSHDNSKRQAFVSLASARGPLSHACPALVKAIIPAGLSSS
jgi:hypothetical protein